MRKLGWLCAILGGAAGALAFEPFNLLPLLPLAPLGIFLGARCAPTLRGAMLRALAGAFVHYLIAICWLMTLGHYNPVAPVGIALLAFYTAWYPMIAAGIARRASARGPFAEFAVFAAAWIFGEWFRTLGRLAMPWALLGQAWAPATWAVQWADCFGELGISLQALIAAGFLFALLRAISPRPLQPALFAGEAAPAARARAIKFASALGALLALILGSSALHYHMWEDSLSRVPPDVGLRVALVQPNIDQDTKMASYMSDDVEVMKRLQEEGTAKIERIIATAPEGTDLILAPETTFSSFVFSVEKELHARIGKMLEPKQADFLFGADRIEIEYDEQGNGRIGAAFNSAWFLPYGQPMLPPRTQDKMRLVPFGEYIPYFNKIPFVESLVGIGSFGEGSRVNIFETRGRKFGTLICFESSFGAQARKVVRKGAEFLTVITNDAWYFDSAGPPQHRNLSILRAIETRRPLLRCANTGISAIISPSGRITQTLAINNEGVVAGTIFPRQGLTFFARFGNLWLALASAATIIALARPPRAPIDSKAEPQ